MPWLDDRKWAHIRLEGTEFGDVPMSTIELKLEVWDSPNSAGIVIDAVRCAKLAKDRGVAGPIIGPSAYFMKSPPVQFSDDAAREMVEGVHPRQRRFGLRGLVELLRQRRLRPARRTASEQHATS